MFRLLWGGGGYYLEIVLQFFCVPYRNGFMGGGQQGGQAEEEIVIFWDSVPIFCIPYRV